ncbi:hypothetical protein [Microbacterium enclense]|uniref:hypothetical protein n=1 Tax=Microbacterium enclense TaxID=993073 RepID=UPI003444F266
MYPTADMAQIKADHWRVQVDHVDEMWETKGHTGSLGNTPKKYHEAAWWAGVEWVLNQQHSIDDLPIGQVIAELRKGNGAIYAPLLSADPKIKTQCPRCDLWTVIDIEGICGNCTYEFQETD